MLINQPPPELFAERPIRSEFSSGLSYRARRLITVSILTLIVSASLIQMYGHFHMRSPTGIPTIRTEGAYKQRPDQPGGLEIPHQDVDVYKSLDGSLSSKDSIERLLPPSEVPQSLASTPPTDLLTKPSQNIESNPVNIAENLAYAEEDHGTTGHDSSAPTSANVQNSNSGQENLSKITNNVFVSDVAKPSETIAAPYPIVPAIHDSNTIPVEIKSSDRAVGVSVPNESQHNLEKAEGMATTDSVVQLASIADQDAAEKAVDQYQTLYASVLGSMRLRANRADLGEKGIHYRVQTEKVSVSEANRVCQALKKQNVRCIVVR